MTPSTSTSVDLVLRLAKERRHQALLDEPLLAFALRSNLVGPALHDLQTALRKRPETTLGEALQGGAGGAVEELQRSRYWPIIVSAVRTFLDKLAARPEDVAARDKIAQPPDSAAELES